MASTPTLKIKRGDDYSLTVTVPNEDISNWTISFTAKKTAKQSDDDAILTADNGPDDHEDEHTTVFNWTHVETAELPPGDSYVYDVQFERDDGTVKSLDQGTLIVTADITRRVPIDD